MFSSADKVKGQGVGSAYNELINMLKKRFSNDFSVKINQYSASDISHYHTVDLPYYLSTFFRKKRGRLVGYVHFVPATLEGSLSIYPPFLKVFNWYLVKFYQRMDELVVVNPSFIDELEKIGIERERVTYIPNFVSTEDFYEVSDSLKQQWKQELSLADSSLIVMGAGQIQKRKGLDDFIYLAKTNPEITFVWVGGFSFGKMTDGYEDYQKVYKNPPANLIFPGIVDREKMVQYYNIADIFLLPSYNELFPMCILEAFNCGTPVMLRNLTLYHSIIEGDYLPCEDVSEMDQVINDCKENPQLLSEYEEKSRRAAQFYSENNVASLWKKFYTSVANKK